MEARDTFPHVLPNTTPLQLDTWHLDDAHAQITLRLSSTQAALRCLGCDVPTRYVHSHYTRTLADLPSGGFGITWRFRVRQLFCRNPACSRRIFTERQPGVTLPWSQGPIESQINRLKMLKRQMFGRAHEDLLVQRFLLAA